MDAMRPSSPAHERSASLAAPGCPHPPTHERSASAAVVMRTDPTQCDVHSLVALSAEEAPLAEHVQALLKETDLDPTGFQGLRDICLQTLQPNALLSHALQHHAAAAAVNAAHAAEESSVVQAQKSPVATKAKQGYTLWRAFKAKELAGGDTDQPDDIVMSVAAPISDLLVVFSGDITPEDFEKIEKSPSGIKADFNRGRRGQFVYLCFKRDAASLSVGSKRPPISEVLLLYPERGEHLPPNYEYVLRRGVPANLNTVCRLLCGRFLTFVGQGVSNEKLYLCYKRSATSYLTDIALIVPKKGEKVPYGYVRRSQNLFHRSGHSYMKIDKSVSGQAFVDSNSNMEVAICYKKQTPSANVTIKIGFLETFKPLWWQATMLDVAARAKEATEKLPLGEFYGRHGNAKDTEIRAETPTTDEPSIAPVQVKPVGETPVGGHDSKLLLLIKYLYPLLYACHIRHGHVATHALKALEACLKYDLLQAHMLQHDAMLLTALTQTINTSCQQAVKDRFPTALTLFAVMVREYSAAMSPLVLHECLKALLFVNDFDDGSARSTLEDLIHAVMAGLPEVPPAAPPTPADFFTNLVTALSDDVVMMVEIARVNENALSISKGHASIYSTGYCQELQACVQPFLATNVSRKCTGGADAACLVYHLIATLVKYATKRNCSGQDQNFEGDCVSVRNTLRLLDVALLSGSPGFKDHLFFGQQIRRFICSAVNAACLMWSESVLGACLSVVSTLWNHYRRHLKIELALLFENVFLRILRATPAVAGAAQARVLDELTPWFQLPHNVIEIFLNFDMDRQFVQQWKVFEQFVAVLCAITETSCANAEDIDEHAPAIGERAMTTLLAILRSLMDASGHAHLILSNDRTRILSMAKGGWELDETSEPAEEAPTLTELGAPLLLTRKSSSSDKGKDGKLGSGYGSTVRERNELQKKSQQLLKRGMEIAETKSFKKALEYLIAMGLIQETPRDITSFLRIYHTFFDEGAIGDYLGEGDEEFKLHVRLTYARAISFTGMTLVEALRHYLTNGGFKLPGEAQKIARMVEAFAQCYFDDAHDAAFASSDTIMILAYSIIMLNTDLHNPQVKKNKMSKEQFVKNNRGIDNGNDVAKALLEDIYDDILANPIQLKGLAYTMAKQDRSTTSNADAEVEKFHVTLAKSVTQSEDLMKDLAHTKYTFNFFGVDASISPDLVKVLFERVWFHFLALSTTILSNHQADVAIVLQCLDMLRYAMSTCLFLEMPVERQAFSNQLTKVKSSAFVKAEAAPDADPDWLTTIDRDAATADPWKVIGDIHVYVTKLKESIEKRKTVETLTSVVKRINHSQVYLHDTTHFVREGDLVKKCRTGRNRLYRFFLFNDQLLYADKSTISGNWNAHQSLRLRLTRLADIPDSLMLRHAFQILNPIKTFTVVAESAAAKAEWMWAIEEAIAEANKKTNRIARRLTHHHGKKRENINLIAEAAKAAAEPPASVPPEIKPPVAEPVETTHQLWLFQVQV
ncbi:brefeldin A-inhibited guanine nucleotide-exchange protein [Achlya hypogyna]|uniref:Brefeldin A-inhibited guanine nucleotide-exchange protein n=1 Tax=Achlya hypogyna TaxID=1202772 RepID=A0A1V9ZGM1_ACHHY|nr:brefeldin A-inhibited guanine nucleotide-exchange protein [Achlya hypogyna]